MNDKNSKKQSFVMYNSFVDAAANLDDAQFKECIIKIRDYALFGKDEKSDNWGVNIILDMAKPLLDKAKNRYDNCVKNGNKGKDYGWHGGRPRKNIKPQEKPQSEPLNVYVNVYENENKNENKNENEKVYENPYGNVKEYDSLRENGNAFSGQGNTMSNESGDNISNQNQEKDENHLQVEDDFISSQETKDNHLGSSNSCSSFQESKDNDGFMDALLEFQDLDESDGIDRDNPLYSNYIDFLYSH